MRPVNPVGIGSFRGLALLAALVAALLLPGMARAASPFTVKRDLPYGPANEQPTSNLLDIYVPTAEADTPRPVFVWIHGGGWFMNDKNSTTMADKARAMIRAGFIFVSINYRLSPLLSGPGAMASHRIRFPVHHQDSARALGWINDHIAGYGGDPRRLVLGGDSAGGQIASLLATRPSFIRARGLGPGQIKAVVSFDTVGFDIGRMAAPAYRRISPGFQRMVFNAFGSPAEERLSPGWTQASPVRFADRSDPPTYFVVAAASKDRWVESRHMASLLGQRFGLVSRKVPVSHDGVVLLLGNPEADQGTTGPVARFARAAVSPVVSRPVIRGQRVLATGAGALAATLKLEVTARPAARLITCRMDTGREALCPRAWRLGRGLHRLRVSTYDATGRISASRLVRVRVGR